MNTFAELQVKPEIVEVLTRDGIITPTEVQKNTIPLVKAGKDVIGISRTGSGKTASFGIPLLEKVQPRAGVQALVLAPTRELANQISGELRKWSKNLNLNIATVFGGVALDPQIRDMERSEVVVGTPGRVMDHLQRRNVDFTKINIFVLDEADKMVEMGFIEHIEQIMSGMPQNRQILLYGATISREVDYLKNKYMHDPVESEAELQVKKDLLEQYYYNIPRHQKFSLLVHLLKKEQTDRVMIFCSKISTVELVTRNLRAQGVKADMIHGKMSQNKRLHTIDRFHKDKATILVASAVAARGLDIKDVTHVINYDLSQDPQEYIHRVGRTARAGESGKAITLLAPEEHGAFGAIFSRYDIGADELQAGDFPKLCFETQNRGRFQSSQGLRRPYPSRDRNQRHNQSYGHRNPARSRFN